MSESEAVPFCHQTTEVLTNPLNRRRVCLQLSSALMFDAVHVVVSAVRELNRSQEIGVKPLSCSSPLIWQHGTSLMNYLRMVCAHTHTRTHADRLCETTDQ